MKYIIIPSIIIVNDKLNSTEKLIMGIIYSLSLKNNVCFATNSYFAKQLKVSNRTITSSLSKLKSEGYIYVEMVDNNRKIYLTELWKNSSTHIENYFYDG